MRIETFPPIISASDARPFFGVDIVEGAPTEEETKYMYAGFLTLCTTVLPGPNNPNISLKRVFATELVEFIDPEYAEDSIQVGVFGSRKADQPDERFEIIVTHEVPDHDDEDDQDYFRWVRQSMYRIGPDGALIREDRTPPSGDELELNKAGAPGEATVPRPHSSTEYKQRDDESDDEYLARWVRTYDIEKVTAQMNIELREYSRRLATAVAQASGDAKEVLRQLGINEQKLHIAEFTQLNGLVRRVFDIAS